MINSYWLNSKGYTGRIVHTTAFVTPDVEHWMEQEIDCESMLYPWDITHSFWLKGCNYLQMQLLVLGTNHVVYILLCYLVLLNSVSF